MMGPQIVSALRPGTRVKTNFSYEDVLENTQGAVVYDNKPFCFVIWDDGRFLPVPTKILIRI